MIKENQKDCQRCSQKFICNTLNVSHCDCSSISLSANTKDFLATTYYSDCLCNNCLQEIEQMVQYAEANPLSEKGDDLKEGAHYYMDGNWFVFTELYHIQKGYCCHNKCRHCAYGYK